MKIAYVLPEFVTEKEAGGLATYYDNISRLLAEAGHQIYIFVLSDRNERINYYPGIIVEKVYVDLHKVNSDIPCSFIRERSRFLAKKLSEYLEEGIRFDIVQYPNLWSLGLERLNVPTVIRISSYQPLLRAGDQEFFDVNQTYKGIKATDYLEEISTLRADAVYGPSKNIADIISGQTGKQIQIIESPFYPRKSESESGKIYKEVLEGKKYILTFGTLKALKGAKLIGDSIYRIFEACPDLTWVFAGGEFPWKDKDGICVSPKDYIKKQASEYANRAVFLGKLNQDELFPIIKQALFCVMPSRTDNLPNTCIEAMALGKIVIGTQGASFEQLIENGKSGFLIERENEEQLVEAVKFVYAMPADKKREISMQAQKRIELMKPEKIAKELIEFYASVIESFQGMKDADEYTRSVIDKYNDEMRSLDIAGAERYILEL